MTVGVGLTMRVSHSRLKNKIEREREITQKRMNEEIVEEKEGMKSITNRT